MSHRLTKKKFRDAALIARWRGRGDGLLRAVGVRRETVEALQLALQGRIVLPGDPDYDQDRMLSNAAFDARPSMIVYCLVENDVRLCLNVAWGDALPFTVRSGGHCTAGFSAGGGMLIDVSSLDDVAVDDASRTAVVGTGCNFRRLNAALDEHGLHVPGGECDEVCVGGYLQGGGQGFTSRTFGMHCDNVVEVRVMLADGTVVTADASRNRDLWWAVRGGTGGNFGVLLTAKLRLRPLGPVYGWAVRWPLARDRDRADAAGALMRLQEGFMRTAPPEMNPQVMICYQADEPDGPDRQPWMLVRGMYLGPAAEGRALVEPLLALPGAAWQYDLVDRYSAVNTTLLEHPHPIPQLHPGVWPPEDKQARYVARDLSREEWLAILDFFVTTPNPWSYMCLEIYGGAINDYPLEDSAFIHRDVAFSAFLDVFWYDAADRPAAERFLRGWCELLSGCWNGRIYQNYPSLGVPDYRANYWGEAFPALLAVKRKYDPQGFFRFEQMIAPYPDEAGPAARPGAAGAAIGPPAIAAALDEPIARGPGPDAGGTAA